MNTSASPSFEPVRNRLEEDGAPALLIQHMERAFAELYSPSAHVLSETDIDPLSSLPTLDELRDYTAAGNAAMKKAVLIKLNGGLGTSMGLNRAKSLLKVKDGLTFLDIIAKQVLTIREQAHTNTPLLFMDSYSTQSDTLDALSAYPELGDSQDPLPLDFLQHRVPKIEQSTGRPATHPDDPELSWCPPGHGDIYVCLQTTGLLNELLGKGYQYAFVSNADNLGAVLDPRILGYMAEQTIPFIMEATARTPADRKGGHLAGDQQGGLLLRESAQCPPDEKEAFQDIDRYRYFNTNNLWIHLPALKKALDDAGGTLPLPILVNHKTLDPRDPDSRAVVQLETAMGSALSAIPGAQAIDVPRTRFAPVKTTDDLLALRSDCFVINDAFHVVQHPNRTRGTIDIQLDPDYYRFIDSFETRFPEGPPSLLHCTRLRVEGDIVFGSNVRCKGEVNCVNPTERTARIPSDAKLEGSRTVSG